MKSQTRKRYKLQSSVCDDTYLVQIPDETFFIDISYLDTPVEDHDYNRNYPACPSFKTDLNITGQNPHGYHSHGADWTPPHEFSVSTRYCHKHGEERSCNINIEYIVSGCMQFKTMSNITVESAKELINDWIN